MRYQHLNDLENVALRTIVERGTAEVIEDDSCGLLLRDTASVVWMLACDDASLARTWLAAHARDGVEILFIAGDGLEAIAHEELALERDMVCSQWVYERPNVPDVPHGFSVRAATMYDLPWIYRRYGDASEDELADVISRGLLFVGRHDGQDIGFVGVHQEGSWGLLHVLDAQRGHGFGEALESWILGHVMGLGLAPYCHVVSGNVASEHLQQKLGLTRTPSNVWWLY